jgi:hypothetical protein
MMLHKDKLNQSMSSRPLLDEMIQNANEVLNALLRLRKHQLNYSNIPSHVNYTNETIWKFMLKTVVIFLIVYSYIQF